MKFRRSLLMLAVACSLALIPFGSRNGQAQTSNLLSSFFLTNTNNVAGYPQTNFGTGIQTIYAVAGVTQQEVAAQYRLEADIVDAQGNIVSLNRIPTNAQGAVVVPMLYHTAQGTTTPFPDGGYCAVAATLTGTGYQIIENVPFSVGTTVAPDCSAATSLITLRLATAEAAPTSTLTPTATLSPTATLIPTVAPTFTPIPSATPIPTATLAPTLVPTTAPTDTPTAIPTPTTPPLKHFVLTINSTVQVGRNGNLIVGVHGTSGHPVSSVRVTIDGRSAGMNKLRVGRTDKNGSVSFANLWPPHSGQIMITGVKSGWWSQQVGLVIR